jgi:hypothetical protein
MVQGLRADPFMGDATRSESFGKTARSWWAGVPRQVIADRALAIYMRRLSANQAGSSADDWRRAELELWQERLTEDAYERSTRAKD